LQFGPQASPVAAVLQYCRSNCSASILFAIVAVAVLVDDVPVASDVAAAILMSSIRALAILILLAAFFIWVSPRFFFIFSLYLYSYFLCCGALGNCLCYCCCCCAAVTCAEIAFLGILHFNKFCPMPLPSGFYVAIRPELYLY